MRSRLLHPLCLLVAVACAFASPRSIVSAQAPASAKEGKTFFGRKVRGGVPRVYDIRDLLVARGGFPMRPFNTEETEEQPTHPSDLDVDVFLEELRGKLQRDGVQRETYVLSAIATNTNATNRRKLVTMKASPAVHAKLEKILRKLREQRTLTFTVEARIYRIGDANGPLPMLLANEVLGEEETVFVLHDQQARTLRKELGEMAKHEKSNVQAISAPRLTLFDSTRGNIMIVDQLAYVADYQAVKILGEPDMILDPVVKTVQTGLGVDLRVMQLEHAERCRVEAAYQRAKLREPIGTKKTRHGEIQTPVIDITNVRVTSNVKVPGWMLISTRKQSRLGIDLILLRITGGAAAKKQQARVVGVGPVAGPVTTLFLETEGTSGLEVGTIVQVVASGPRKGSKKTSLSTGTVQRIVGNVAIVTLGRSLERATGRTTWSCTWTPSKRERRAR